MKLKSAINPPKTLPEEIETSLQFLEKTLNENFPGGLVPRNMIGKATGGLYHPRTQANRDSLGRGIKGSFRLGGRVVYPIKSIIADARANITI